MLLDKFKLQNFVHNFNNELREDTDEDAKFNTLKKELSAHLKKFDKTLEDLPDLNIYIDQCNILRFSYFETINNTMEIRLLWKINDLNEDDIRELYGDKVNAATKIKLDKRKADIETRRVSIIKEIAFALEDSKKKMFANGNAEKFLTLGLIACPIIMSAAISDTVYKMVMEATTMAKSFFPLHTRLLAGYAILLFVTGLILKQGVFLHLQDKLKDSKLQKTGSTAKTFMLLLSLSLSQIISIIIPLHSWRL